MKYFTCVCSALAALGLNAAEVDLPRLDDPVCADLCVNECLNINAHTPKTRIFELEIDISGSSISNETLVSIGDTQGEYLSFSDVLFQYGVSRTNIYLRCNSLKDVYTAPAPAADPISLKMCIRQDYQGNPLYLKFYCNNDEFQFPDLSLTNGIPGFFRPSEFKALKFTRRGVFTGDAPAGKVIFSAEGLKLILR